MRGDPTLHSQEPIRSNPESKPEHKKTRPPVRTTSHRPTPTTTTQGPAARNPPTQRAPRGHSTRPSSRRVPTTRTERPTTHPVNNEPSNSPPDVSNTRPQRIRGPTPRSHAREQNSGRAPTGRRAPPTQTTPREPRGTPRRGPGGYFGQNPSARGYTGSTNADTRNVLSGIETLVTQIGSSKKLLPIDSRQLRGVRSRMAQLNGLLVNGQVNPNSYEQLANMVEALLSQDVQAATRIQSEITSDPGLRTASRSWLPTLKTLAKLTEKLL